MRKNETNKEMVAVAYIEFDLDEGPQFKLLFPSSFPIDYQQEFEIANYALYAEGIYQLQTDNFFVFGYTYRKKIIHSRTDTTKASVAIIYKHNQHVRQGIPYNFLDIVLIPLIKKKLAKDAEFKLDDLRELYNKFKTWLKNQENKSSLKLSIEQKDDSEDFIIIYDSISALIYLILPKELAIKANSKDIPSLVKNILETRNNVYFALSENARFLITTNKKELLKNFLIELNNAEKNNTLLKKQQLIKYFKR